MKRIIYLLTLFMANNAFADFVGLRISGGVFDYEVSGTIRDDPSVVNEIDVKTVLGFQDDSDTHAYVYIEHPIPILPNVRLGTTSMKLAGTGNTGSGFVFNGVTFPASQSVTSSFDMSHTEVALYYELWDTGFDLDLGLNFKLFDGDVSIATSGATTREEFDGTVPMIYAAVTIPLPLTGLSIAGDLSTISADDAEFTDYFVRIRYETDFALGLELGYRSLSLDYEDTDVNEFADIEMEGPYLNLHLAF